VVLDFGALSHLVREGYAEGVDSLSKASIANGLLKASESTYQRLSLNNSGFLDWDTYVDRLIALYSKL
jgi:hypothetical protein